VRLKCNYSTLYDGSIYCMIIVEFIRKLNIKCNGDVGDIVCGELGDFVCIRCTLVQAWNQSYMRVMSSVWTTHFKWSYQRLKPLMIPVQTIGS
jgi:hypothetical protein